MHEALKSDDPNSWLTSTISGEGWRPVCDAGGPQAGWPYWCSDDGRIYSPRTETVLKPYYNQQGEYLIVDLRWNGKRAQRSVHALVLETFVGPRPDGEQAHHIDGDEENNSLHNLEYVDAAANASGDVVEDVWQTFDEAPF